MTAAAAWAAVAAALLGGGGIGSVFVAILGRRKGKADAADVLTDSVLQFAEQLKKEAGEARDEVRRVRQEATLLADELHRIRLAIMAPAATIDGLRALIRPSSATNGQP